MFDPISTIGIVGLTPGVLNAVASTAENIVVKAGKWRDCQRKLQGYQQNFKQRKRGDLRFNFLGHMKCVSNVENPQFLYPSDCDVPISGILDCTGGVAHHMHLTTRDFTEFNFASAAESMLRVLYAVRSLVLLSGCSWLCNLCSCSLWSPCNGHKTFAPVPNRPRCDDHETRGFAGDSFQILATEARKQIQWSFDKSQRPRLGRYRLSDLDAIRNALRNELIHSPVQHMSHGFIRALEKAHQLHLELQKRDFIADDYEECMKEIEAP